MSLPKINQPSLHTGPPDQSNTSTADIGFQCRRAMFSTEVIFQVLMDGSGRNSLFRALAHHKKATPEFLASVVQADTRWLGMPPLTSVFIF